MKYSFAFCILAGSLIVGGCAADAAPGGDIIAGGSEELARDSDLSRDSARANRQVERNTPFVARDAKSLPRSLQRQLRGLAERCFVHTQRQRGSVTIDEGYSSVCPNEVSTITEQNSGFRQTVLIRLVPGTEYTVVSYDGLDSDHGDQADTAIYDRYGKRLGVDVGAYGNLDVLWNLASFVGANVPVTVAP